MYCLHVFTVYINLLFVVYYCFGFKWPRLDAPLYWPLRGDLAVYLVYLFGSLAKGRPTCLNVYVNGSNLRTRSVSVNVGRACVFVCANMILDVRGSYQHPDLLGNGGYRVTFKKQRVLFEKMISNDPYKHS